MIDSCCNIMINAFMPFTKFVRNSFRRSCKSVLCSITTNFLIMSTKYIISYMCVMKLITLSIESDFMHNAANSVPIFCLQIGQLENDLSLTRCFDKMKHNIAMIRQSCITISYYLFISKCPRTTQSQKSDHQNNAWLFKFQIVFSVFVFFPSSSQGSWY